MPRIKLGSVSLLVMLLLAACGGNYTGTSSINSLATATPFPSAATAAPAAATAMPAASAPAMTAAPAETAMPAAPATGALPDLKGRKVLIGTDSTYPPFESLDTTSNKIVGFDVDLMTEIGKLINIQPEFQTAAFDTIFTALSKKQFDAVMSAVTITDERKKQVDFSDPYVSIGQRVVALKSNTAIRVYTDLKANNLKVGVQRGTTGEKAALEKVGVADENLQALRGYRGRVC